MDTEELLCPKHGIKLKRNLRKGPTFYWCDECQRNWIYRFGELVWDVIGPYH